MDKTELQNNINRYKNEMQENNNEIASLKQKIENLKAEISRCEKSISEISTYYSDQRSILNGCDLSNKGKAVGNYVKANLDLFSVSKENELISDLNGIINYLQINIDKMNEMIGDLEYENTNYSNKITDYNKEITKINNKEKENNSTNKKKNNIT